MWGHLPVTNLSLFLWQTNSHALPQKAVVKPQYPKADRCLYCTYWGIFFGMGGKQKLIFCIIYKFDDITKNFLTPLDMQ